MGENIYLLVGYLITIFAVFLGFIFSMITTIITNFFHERRDKQNQQWKLEERKWAEIIKNKKHRIDQGEEFADFLLKWTTDLSMLAKSIIINPYSESSKIEANKKADELMVSTELSYRRRSVIYALGDDRLTALTQNYTDLILKESDHVKELLDKWIVQQINWEEELEKRSVFLAEAKNTHGEMLTIFDELLNDAIANT